jgi:shikimate kinase
MGTGKTTAGRLVAARAGWPLRDSDPDIHAAIGLSARALQAQRGADVLHGIEARHLLDALADQRPSVVCAAASTIDDAACRHALAASDVLVVWLQASLDTMVARYDADPHRPRYADGTRARLASQLAERSPKLAEVADATLAVDGLAATDVAERIEALAGC